MEYPDFVMEKLKAISQRTEIELEQLKKEYQTFFESDFIKDDKQFANDDERHRYAKGVFWTRYILRKPVKPFNLIPIGADSVRKNKAGVNNTSVFALDSKGKLRRVSFKGDICKVAKNLTFFSMYKDVSLSEFKDSSDLLADNRAVFKDPVKVNMSAEQLLETLGYDRVTILDAKNNLSKMGSDGYLVRTDWKCIRGIVQRHNRSPEDAESEWGVYTISDETVDPDKMEPEVTPSGEILPPGFSVWVSPSLMNYGMESECLFYGTLQADTKGKVTMNCYCIVPLHVHTEE